MVGTAWLKDYEQRLADIGARVDRARSELAEVSATASSAAGAVTVTVNSAGVLQQLSFGERAEDLTRPLLAEAVLQAVRTAHAAAARRSVDALAPLIGGTEASRLLTSQLPTESEEAP
jgi:DNA-binding protein YbaB